MSKKLFDVSDFLKGMFTGAEESVCTVWEEACIHTEVKLKEIPNSNMYLRNKPYAVKLHFLTVKIYY